MGTIVKREDGKPKEIHATKNDLRRRDQNLPIDQINMSHLMFSYHYYNELMVADIVTITMDDETRVLKDRSAGIG